MSVPKLSPSDVLRSVLYKRFSTLGSSIPFLFRVELIANNSSISSEAIFEAGNVVNARTIDLRPSAKNVGNVTTSLYTNKYSVLYDDMSSEMVDIIRNAVFDDMFFSTNEWHGNYGGRAYYRFFVMQCVLCTPRIVVG
jgi:hypothetical protein